MIIVLSSFILYIIIDIMILIADLIYLIWWAFLHDFCFLVFLIHKAKHLYVITQICNHKNGTKQLKPNASQWVEFLHFSATTQTKNVITLPFFFKNSWFYIQTTHTKRIKLPEHTATHDTFKITPLMISHSLFSFPFFCSGVTCDPIARNTRPKRMINRPAGWFDFIHWYAFRTLFPSRRSLLSFPVLLFGLRAT